MEPSVAEKQIAQEAAEEIYDGDIRCRSAINQIILAAITKATAAALGHSGQAVDRQGEWQKRRYPHAKPDSDSWDIYAGETLIVGDLMEDECDKIITAHNAALAAGRADKAEGAAHHMEACRSLLNVSNDDVLYEAIDDMQDQLLSALAAIDKHNKRAGKSTSQFPIDVDLSPLHQHDAEMRKPLVEALIEARTWIKSVAPHAPLIKTIDSALAKVKEKP